MLKKNSWDVNAAALEYFEKGYGGKAEVVKTSAKSLESLFNKYKDA